MTRPDHTLDRGLDTRRERHTNRRNVLLATLILIVVGAVLTTYWPVLSCEALYFDDGQYLTQNHLVQKPGWTSTKRFLFEVLEPSTVAGYYQPLAMISLMLDYALGGRTNDLRQFHRTSLILHALNTALLIVFLYLLFDQLWVAAVVGLLFGVHPVTIESIPWMAERKSLLAAFFVLLCLAVYVRYARKTNRTLWCTCLAMYVLALVSKPTSTPLPALLLLLDYWPLRRLSKRAVLEKVPFFVVGVVAAIVTVVSQARTASVVLPKEYPPLALPLILCHNIVFYPLTLVWPAKSSWFYPFPEPLSLAHPMVLAGVIGTAALMAALLVSLRWTRALAVGWLFFFVAIFPTMGVIGFTVVIAADRFVYLPMIGFLLPVACLLTWFWRDAPRVAGLTTRRLTIIVAALALAATEATATRHYLVYWSNTEDLFRHLLATSPRECVLHWNLGNALRRQDRLEEATEAYHTALQLYPDSHNAHHNLGMTLYQQGRREEAVTHYLAALRSKPDLYTTHSNLAVALVELGKSDEAMAHFVKAVEIRPEYAEGQYNLGHELLTVGRIDEAIEHLTQALKIKPHYASAHIYLGGARMAQGNVEQAIAHYNEALRIEPDSYAAYNNLGIALARKGRTEEAVKHYTAALRLEPDSFQAHSNLGRLLARQGKVEEAIRHYRAALRLEPGAVGIRGNLGVALLNQGRIDEALIEFGRVLQADPNNADAQFSLGYALEIAGRLEQAVDAYRNALRINPRHEHARERLDAALESLRGR